MKPKVTHEEKLDDLIVNSSIFIVAIFAVLLSPLVKGLRKFAIAYPLFTASLALVATSLLIADKAFTGTVDHRVLGFALILAIIGTCAIIARVTEPQFHEFEPVDHKSASSDRNDWLADL